MGNAYFTVMPTVYFMLLASFSFFAIGKISCINLEMVDGGGRFEEVCHAVVVASCGLVGGAIGSTAGPIGTASGAIAGSAFGEYIWQSVMED